MQLNSGNVFRCAGRARAARTRGLSDASPSSLVEALEQRQLLAADLTYVDLRAATNALPGGMLRLNSTIENLGDTEVQPPIAVNFYLSQNETFEEGVDTLLGTYTHTGMPIPPTNGVLGFAFDVTIPQGTPLGTWHVIAKADSTDQVNESNENNNSLTTSFFVGNIAPTIGSVSVDRDPVGTQGFFTMTANNVQDTDDVGNTLGVRFFLDADQDGVFSEVTDTLLGSGVRNGSTFTLTQRQPLPGAGSGRVFAVATDGLDTTVSSTTFTVVESSVPTLGSLAGPTQAVRRGRNITLTGRGLGDTSDNVAFYRDSNRDGVLDIGVDQFLGTGTGSGTNRPLRFAIDPAWGPGTQRFFAVAVDELGQPSTPTRTVTVRLLPNAAPAIQGGISAEPAIVRKGSTLTLTALNVADDDGPQRVEFYRESSGNNAFNPAQDELLGTGTRQGANWVFSFTVPTRFRNGNNTFYASAVDIVGARSPVQSIQVRVQANTRPAIASFNISRASAARNQQVTFIANNVTDNGSIQRVEFWFDANGNGAFDAGADRLLVNGNRVRNTNNWRRVFRLPGDLPTGNNKAFFAVAVDNLGTRSVAKKDTLNITA